MKNMFKRPYNIMLYKERAEFEEFGRAQKDFRLCRVCHAIYYSKSWHHLRTINISGVKKRETLWITKCPACKMVADNQYEGLVSIKNIPSRFENELQNMIKAYARRAYEKDCQHRLIALNKKDQSNWMVTTTENQLANRLAQKIRDVFDKVDVKISYSKEPDDVERVKVSFKPSLSLAPLWGR